jgi:cupin 2 domain-containing protein
MKVENLFDGIPDNLPDELFTRLHQAKGLRIERIVSQGQASPAGFWYDQEESEWVVVLQGYATIQFEDEPEPMELQAGSYLNIPAHAKHRVVSTSLTEKTVWLAIHYSD